MPATIHKAMALILSMLMAFLALALHVSAQPTPGSALSSTYYNELCGPHGTKKFQFIANQIVAPLVSADPTLVPSLTRMCFHEGFVKGAEGSVLLDNSPGFPPVEKDGAPNKNSLRGFEVIDKVKSAMESICPGVISCADILQESVRVALKTLHFGSLPYNITYGRRDGNESLASETLTNLPPPFFNYAQLKAIFAAKGFSATELAILSGGHCFGVSHCSSFTQRLYNFYGNGSGTDPSIDPGFAQKLKAKCPQNATVDRTVPLNFARLFPDIPKFDNQYFENVLDHKVLFTSDKELEVGDPATVNLYAADNNRFRSDFILALVKLTELQVKLYPDGQIRADCRKRN